MKEKIKHNAFLLAIVTGIVGLDQWTKLWVSHKFMVGQGFSPIPALGEFFKIVHWHNTGAAFGMLQNANIPLLVVSLIIGLAVLFYYQVAKKDDWLVKISLSLIVAGAVGNIIDRIKFGYVIDFLSFEKFPVFNVADSAVTVGVFLMVLHYLIEERKALSVNKQTEQENEDVVSKSETQDSQSETQDKEME